jgi:predicted MFS family arabinose efflux permease
MAAVATLRADQRAEWNRAADRRSQVRVRDLTPLASPIAAAVLAGASSAAIWTFGRTVMASSRTGEETYSILAWMLLGAFGVLGATAGKIVQVWSLRTAWNLTSLAMAGATIVLGVAPGIPFTAYSAVALFGASYTALCGVLIIWAVRTVPDRAAEGTAVLFIALAIGQALGSATLGVLFERVSPVLAFTVAGILGMIAVLPAMKRQPDTSSRTALRQGAT